MKILVVVNTKRDLSSRPLERQKKKALLLSGKEKERDIPFTAF